MAGIKGEPRNNEAGRYAALGLNDLHRRYVEVPGQRNQWKTLSALTPPECRRVVEHCTATSAQTSLRASLLKDVDVWDEFTRWYVFEALVRFGLLRTEKAIPDEQGNVIVAPPTEQSDDSLFVAEASALLGLTKKQILHRAASKTLPGWQDLNRRWNFKRRDVLAYRDRMLAAAASMKKEA